ncbi:MAG TPA: hypothetical protein VLE44_01835 [Candidatus Saccharimonadales bacterium]|nr:hypothetical protein [Candidatus Saccharimonadales bacterium]
MSISEQFKKEQETQNKKSEEEKALQIQISTASLERSNITLDKAILELDIYNKLQDIRDNIWKLGEVAFSHKDDSSETNKPRAKAVFTLKAKWPYYVPGTETEDRETYQVIKIPASIKEREEDLTVEISAYESSFGVVVGERPWNSSNGNILEKLDLFLVEDCQNRISQLPYSSRKEEAEEEISKNRRNTNQ